MVTQAELMRILSYSPDTGIFTRIAAPAKRNDLLGKQAGSLHSSDGYVRIFINRKSYLAHRLVWLYVHGEFPALEIDHIDGVRSNNKVSNLRSVTKSENLQNLKHAKRDNLSSGALGVCFDAVANKFRAAITLNRKRKHLGYFETSDLAHSAYLDAKRVIHAGCMI